MIFVSMIISILLSYAINWIFRIIVFILCCKWCCKRTNSVATSGIGNNRPSPPPVNNTYRSVVIYEGNGRPPQFPQTSSNFHGNEREQVAEGQGLMEATTMTSMRSLPMVQAHRIVDVENNSISSDPLLRPDNLRVPSAPPMSNLSDTYKYYDGSKEEAKMYV